MPVDKPYSNPVAIPVLQFQIFNFDVTVFEIYPFVMEQSRPELGEPKPIEVEIVLLQ
jgi:hypothetical protein